MRTEARSRRPGVVVAYDAEHAALVTELLRSLERRRTRCWHSEPLEILDAEAFEYLLEVLHAGDVLVVVLDARRLDDPEMLGLARTIRWLGRRASFALELVLVTERESAPSRPGLHVVPIGAEGITKVREVAGEIAARAKNLARGPRARPTADELAVVDVIVRSEADTYTALHVDDLVRALRLSADRAWRALRPAAARGWLEVTDLAPLRAGGPSEALVQLTERGWTERANAVLSPEQRRGWSLAEHRHRVTVEGALRERREHAEARAWWEGDGAGEPRGMVFE